MKKSLPTLLLTTVIWTALYSQHVQADLAAQCLLGVPRYDQPLFTGDIQSLPVNIESQKSDVHYPDKTTFRGNVRITQGSRTLYADQVDLKQSDTSNGQPPVRTITATGNVRYSDEQIRLNGPQAWSNLNTKDTDVYDGSYLMVNRQGRGTAKKMRTRDNSRYTILDNGTFTSCLPGDNSWSIVGSEVIHDRDEEVAEIWNARFKIGPVPVFYSPYLQLPIGDTRRSGFLIPSMEYSNNGGFEFSQPWYWNIAPNYDATFTPHYISERGMQWQNELRYLTAPGLGLMAFDWLPNDRLFHHDNRDKNDTRWLFYWGHNGVMEQVWRFNADFTKVSDYRYFNDLSTTHGSSTDGYASQKFSLGYAEQNWNTNLSTKKFQVFTQGGDPNAYRAEPQLDIHYYKDGIGLFDLHLYSQVAKFSSEGDYNPKATRWHLQPAMSLPLSNSWGSLDTEIKMMGTHYQQDIPNEYYNSHIGIYSRKLDSSVNRFLPQVKTDGKVVFERPMKLITEHTQTIEPRAQYLYIPYRDQSMIHIYDTTLLQNDYSGLFRDQAFSGLDRIASANQVAAGMTSRIYDAELDERFNISVGQIYYFTPPRIGPRISGPSRDERDNEYLNRYGKKGSRTWAGDSQWKINELLGVRGGLQYDANINSLAIGNGVLEYRQDQDRILQLNYRYASADYLTAMVSNIPAAYYQKGISQVGSVGSWPIVDRWAVVGSYYYDTKWEQTANAMAGVQYNTCCWAIRLNYERKINEWNENSLSSQYENKISFKFELRGLGSSSGLGSTQMLSEGILPYQRAF